MSGATSPSQSGVVVTKRVETNTLVISSERIQSQKCAARAAPAGTA
jgi:hypothetical protein